MSRHAALTQQEFDTLLSWFSHDREQAGERYEAIRRMLAKYFEWRRCVPSDEYVDETIDRVARRLATGERIRAADAPNYFRGVARKVCLEWYKQMARPIPASTPPETETPSPLLARLEDCLRMLSPEGRELLETYYLEQRKDLPARLGITPNAVRVRVFKEKRKLIACMVRQLTRAAEAPNVDDVGDVIRVLKSRCRSFQK
jgi:DNA-directed RNA polymerase specialized sigma24 family protein